MKLKNDKKLRKLIKQYRKHPDNKLLKPFKVNKKKTTKNDSWFSHYDDNSDKRIALIIELANDFNQNDRKLIQWLIKTEWQASKLGGDNSFPLALLSFMLYKYMKWADLPMLFDCKFGHGSDAMYTIDSEIIFGFDAEATLAYLKEHKKQTKVFPKDMRKSMIETMEHYLSNPDAKFRTRKEYIEYFEKKRLAYLQEELAYDYGLAKRDEE